MKMSFWDKSRSMLERVLSHTSGSSVPSEDEMVVLLWAPAIDALTHETSRWATTLVLPQRVHIHKLIGHVLREEIEDCLTAASPRSAVACFIGHGLGHALLGHPLVSKGERSAASPIYDIGLIRLGPGSLFAYCCHAGRELGRNFAAGGRGAFLGYTQRINIYVNESCRKIWLNILQTIISKIVEDQGIRPSHRQTLHQLYEDAFWLYQDEDVSGSEERFFMQMYLVEQQESIIYHPGEN
jgi:hypothetical protein